MSELAQTDLIALKQDIQLIKEQLFCTTNTNNLIRTMECNQLENFDASTFEYYNCTVEYLKRCKNDYNMRFDLFRRLTNRNLGFQCVKYLIDCYNEGNTSWDEHFNFDCRHDLSPIQILCKYGDFEMAKYVLDKWIEQKLNSQGEISDLEKYNLIQIICSNYNGFNLGKTQCKILCYLLDIYNSYNLNLGNRTNDSNTNSLIMLIEQERFCYDHKTISKHVLDIFVRRGMYTDLMYANTDGETLLDILCREKKWNSAHHVFDVLIENNIPLTTEHQKCWIPINKILLSAPFEFVSRVLNVLIDNKYDLLTIDDKSSYAPLHIICMNEELKPDEHLSILKIWIKNGLSVETISENGKKPIHYIIERFHNSLSYCIDTQKRKFCSSMKKILDIWIENKFDLNCEMDDGIKPIHMIFHTENPEIIKYAFKIYDENNLDFYCESMLGTDAFSFVYKHFKYDISKKILYTYAKKNGYLLTICMMIKHAINIFNLNTLFFNGYVLLFCLGFLFGIRLNFEYNCMFCSKI